MATAPPPVLPEPTGVFADVSDIKDTEDGGALVTLDENMPDASGEFYANLAEDMSASDLSRIGTQWVELIEKDKDARKRRDEQYEEGIRRTGLGDDAPGGASFQGASKVVHPLLTESCVDFSARAIKELFPAEGPVKDHIVGEATQEKVDKAYRKVQLMNWQLTTQCAEFRGTLEQTLTQVPLGGAQYIKLSWDERRNRPEFVFVAIDDLYLPFAASSFLSAQRKTHVQYITAQEYRERVESGMYRDIDIVGDVTEPERSSASKATDKIEGRAETSYNEDGLRTVFEIYAIADIEDKPKPYIISIDKTSSQVLAIYRNWAEKDESCEELQWIVEFPFIPWRGAYPIGLPHMIGGLSAASTGALRALLDSAHINNAASMLKLKGGTKGGQSLTIEPTQVLEIEGGLNVDDIRKLAMPLPFNPPSTVLFQLLGFVIDAAKGVVRTTMEEQVDQGANTPVGTTLARIEQGMVVFSAIHARLHNAMARTLQILHRLNGLYLDDANIVKNAGEGLATRADFNGPFDVVPVSDPNIFSEAQRFAQVQAVAQRSQLLPQLYDLRKVEERLLDTLRIPNGKDLLAPALEPKEQNAVNENVTASMGKPIVAFPEQDHIAHLSTHLAFMQSPMLGSSQLIAPTFLPAMLGHLKEHIALWYASAVFELCNQATGVDVGETMRGHKSADERRPFDLMLAEASATVTMRADEVFGGMPPVIAAAMQMMQQMAPPPQLDPNVSAQVQIEQGKTQAKVQSDAQKAQIDAQKLQQEAANDQEQAVIDARELALKEADAQQEAQADAEHEDREDQRLSEELLARRAMNQEDNQTAKDIAFAETISGERVALSTGTGINPNP